LDKNIEIGAIEDVKYIEAGGTKTISIPISAKLNIETAIHRFKISVTEYFGYDIDDAFLVLNSFAFQSSKISFAGIELSDSSENSMAIIQDDKLQAGEQVEVKVILQNIEQGLARNVEYSITTTNSDIFINNSKGIIYEIKGGDIAEFTFSLSPNKKVISTTQLPIFMTIKEKVNGTEIDNFQLPIYLNSKPKAPEIIQVKSDFASLEKNIAKFESTSDKYDIMIDIENNIPEIGIVNVNRFALIIGNENYKENGGLNADVIYAKNDAQTFKQYALKTLGIPESNIKFLEDATKAKMTNQINNFIALMDISAEKREFFIFYAGHGYPDFTTKDAYLMPVDVTSDNLGDAIKLSDFYDKLMSKSAKRITIFLDACFSGGGRTGDDLVIARSGVKIVPNKTSLTGNLIVFAATTDDQVSKPYEKYQHGMFSFYLFKTLQEFNGNITYGELANNLTESVRTYSLTINNSEQIPNINVSKNIINSWENWKLNE